MALVATKADFGWPVVIDQRPGPYNGSIVCVHGAGPAALWGDRL